MGGTSLDPDAAAFLTAAGITDPTQQSAVNTLVVSLKSDGIWTKMSALYPFVGGSAASHKYNLKDPRDLNAAYRLVFSGGWTHSSTGALPNGTNAFADTFLNNNVLAQNNNHISGYSRTDSNTASTIIASWNSGFGTSIYPRQFNAFYFNNNSPTQSNVLNTDSRGFFLNTRRNATQILSQKNTTQNTILNSSTTHITTSFKISRTGDFIGEYSNRELALISIGDGLSDTDSLNLYNSVQTFNTTLGRSVGPQTVSDADAQAFVTAADIQDQVQADAVNQLVIDMKAANIWTKMKAIYPFVGGTATTHKFNLKNPLDTNAAFRLSFVGGWTHSANGALPNGTNAWANTFFVSANNFASKDNAHYSFYSRTNLASDGIEIGVNDAPSNQGLYTRSAGGNAIFILNGSATFPNVATANSLGFYQANRNALNTISGWKNGIKLSQISSISVVSTFPSFSIGAYNMNNLTALYYSSKQCAFASIGDGLTDTEAANFYTAVQTFQTTLSRQV
jgi:hypothetical protein